MQSHNKTTEIKRKKKNQKNSARLRRLSAPVRLNASPLAVSLPAQTLCVVYAPQKDILGA